MTAANVVASGPDGIDGNPDDDDWLTDPKVSAMGRLFCADGFHGVATASCALDNGVFAFSGCVENECLTNSGNADANYVTLAGGDPAAVKVSLLGTATCTPGYTQTSAAAVTCLDHGGVFAYSGCAANQHRPIRGVCNPLCWQPRRCGVPNGYQDRR